MLEWYVFGLHRTPLLASVCIIRLGRELLMGRETAVAQPYPYVVQPRRGGIVGFLRDILRGAFLGDFALDLGLAGAITQVALAYTPVVGDFCALRDMIGDIYHRDRVGFLLSAIALIPVFGGIAKTVDVIHNTRRVGNALVRSRQSRLRQQQEQQQQVQQPQQPQLAYYQQPYPPQQRTTRH